jgi:hypothetical protein
MVFHSVLEFTQSWNLVGFPPKRFPQQCRLSTRVAARLMHKQRLELISQIPGQDYHVA